MVESPNESMNIAQAKGQVRAETRARFLESLPVAIASAALSLSLPFFLSLYKRLNPHGSLALAIFENQIKVGHENVADRGTIINGRRLNRPNCRKLTLIRQMRRPREISLAITDCRE